MHTTELNDGWIAVHNGDYSGDVTLRKLDAIGNSLASIRVPFEVIEKLVAEKIRDERISKLEQATTAELIAGRSP